MSSIDDALSLADTALGATTSIVTVAPTAMLDRYLREEMMFLTDNIVIEVESALAAVLTSEGPARLEAMTDFMGSFERLARAETAGEATWAEVRTWARRTSEHLCRARDALTDWELELGELLYGGGEERAARALNWRSQHALARELFTDTPAHELLAAYEDEGVDRDLRDRAERLALGRPSWAPRTHTWWRSE